MISVIKHNEKNSFGDQMWAFRFIDMETLKEKSTCFITNPEGSHISFMKALEEAKEQFKKEGFL